VYGLQKNVTHTFAGLASLWYQSVGDMHQLYLLHFKLPHNCSPSFSGAAAWTAQPHLRIQQRVAQISECAEVPKLQTDTRL